MSDSDSEGPGVPLLEPLSRSNSPEPSAGGGTKRKRYEPEEKTESKRAAKKRNKAKKPKDISDEALDVEAGVNHAIKHMDPQLLADHIAQRTKRFHSELSVVELEDLHVPSTAIQDTTSFAAPRTLANLPTFLTYTSSPRRSTDKKNKSLSDAPKAKASPHTLVIASAGLRAADLTRSLRQFQTQNCMVAKLFAKHIKLKEAVAMVENCRMGIGVGTPKRVLDLVVGGCLRVDALERVVVDASFIDGKKRGVLDMRETVEPLVALLTTEKIRERYGSDKGEERIELLFY